MTFSKALALAGLTLIGAATPGWAADWGGVRDMGGGVPIPVPAPAPVPTYDYDSDWYVGLGIGANISQSAKIKDSDIDYLGNSTPGYLARDSGDIGASPIFSGSFGRYITPSLRAEVVFDYSPDAEISENAAAAISLIIMLLPILSSTYATGARAPGSGRRSGSPAGSGR